MLLAIDTSGPFCSAAVAAPSADGNKIIAERSDDLGRGHAEHLMSMLGEMLEQKQLSWGDFSKIACTTGPGSFTGLRVGLSAARGLALGLQCPCIGISVFECFAHHAARHDSNGENHPLTVAMDARRGQVWMQSFNAEGKSMGAPIAAELSIAASQVPESVQCLAGSAATLLANGPRRFKILNEFTSPPIASLALLGISRDESDNPPEPLYLRAPDAKPQVLSDTGLEVAI